jgi:hypothetical protein
MFCFSKIQSGFDHKNKKTLKVIFILTSIFWLVSCVSAKNQLLLSNKGATIKVASEEIEVVKIDHTFADIKYEGTIGTPYSSVVLAPGAHRIIVNSPGFEKGSVTYLLVILENNHNYIIKQKILDRVKAKNFVGLQYNTNNWKVDVWVEDIETSKRVSEIIKVL